MKRKALHLKESINWYNLSDEMQRYYYDQGLDNWREHFLPAMSGVIDDGGKHWAGALGMRFDLRHLLAEDWFSKYTLVFAQQTSATNLAGVHDLVEVALSEGWGPDKLSKQMGMMFDQWAKGNINPDKWVTDRLPRYRTNAIARTETMRSLNAGNAALYSDWGVAQHEWLATLDAATRPAHAAAHGQIVDVGKPFTVGGEQVMQPGDGSPENSINCRCTTIPVIPAEGLNDQTAEDAQDAASLNIQNALDLHKDDFVQIRQQLPEKMKESFEAVQNLKDQQNGMSPKIDALTAQIDAISDQRLSAGLSSDEYDRLTDEMQSLMKQRSDAIRQWADYGQRAIDAGAADWKLVKDNFGYGSDSDINTTLTATGKQAIGKKAADVVDFLKGMVNGDTIEDMGNIKVTLSRSRAVRAYALSDNGEIIVGRASGAKTIAHEIGHVLETRLEGWHDRAVEFLEMRTEGEIATSLRKLTGIKYAAGEIAKPDQFFDPYVGKLYLDKSGKNRMTEVISMGIERLYDDPLGFSRDDPQHFDFIIGLLRGWL